MSAREAFEQTEHCLDERLGSDGIYVDNETAMNFLVWLVAYTTTTWNREAA